MRGKKSHAENIVTSALPETGPGVAPYEEWRPPARRRGAWYAAESLVAVLREPLTRVASGRR